MANSEHLAILREGVDAWNLWRDRNSHMIEPDLGQAQLCNLDLKGIDLSFAILGGADLSRSDLSNANLTYAGLFETNLRNASLQGAILSHAKCFATDLDGANLTRANLDSIILRSANLNRANMQGSDLRRAFIRRSSLEQVILTDAILGFSTFACVDLRSVSGLETLHHSGPSTIGIDTFELSEGKLSEEFLRAAGISQAFIEFARSLSAM